MKEEILTAKEWLDTNLIKDCMLSNKEIEGMDLDGYTTCSEAMELYAKSKNKILEDRIKEFRDKLTEVQFNMFLKDQENKIWIIEEKSMLALIFMEYDKHFNIQNNIKE